MLVLGVAQLLCRGRSSRAKRAASGDVSVFNLRIRQQLQQKPKQQRRGQPRSGRPQGDSHVRRAQAVLDPMSDDNGGRDDDEGKNIRRCADEQLWRLEAAQPADELVGDLVLPGVKILKRFRR